jgi:hypothetical protein
MRHDRTPVRIAKLAILFGAIGLIVEGLFELRLLVAPFLAPPSVPGQSKIIEHFLIQHVAFPVIGMLLVFAPLRLTYLFASRFAGGLLAALAVLVSVPELIVSRGDLFRPYPFELHAPFLKAVQMVEFGSLTINLLQAQHVLFAHLALMGSITLLAVKGGPLLMRFAGPRTGETSPITGVAA